jgi:L-threonylcarbamoyladenylate synthase
MRETFSVQTKITTSPDEAAAFIRDRGIVAFPTETVYGLGANVFDAEAVAKIFAAKNRPADNPLIAHVANLEQIEQLTLEIGGNARRFIDAFFPGPLTLVLQKSEQVPLIATAGLDTIGVRMPRHELTREFLAACGVPVVAPSANLSGRPSPTTWQAVFEDLDGRIDCILQGEATEIGLESTVVDCTGEVPVLLRQGSVSLEELRRVVPGTIASSLDPDVVRSPGLKHKHYSPRAKVVLIDGRSEISNLRFENAGYIGINDPPAAVQKRKICTSIDDYAHSLFEFFRECDREGLVVVYCETVEETGIGAALMDRLRRAAE